MAKLVMSVSVLLVIIISVVLVRPGSATTRPPPTPQPMDQCWSTLTTIPNCVTELYMALLKGQFGVVGPVCCKAITEISDQCWSRIFPVNPLFPPQLKKSCVKASPPPPKHAA